MRINHSSYPLKDSLNEKETYRKIEIKDIENQVKRLQALDFKFKIED